LGERIGDLRRKMSEDPRLIEGRVKELDWRLQTSVLDPDEEKRVVEEVRSLTRKLARWREIEKLVEEGFKLESEVRSLIDQAKASYQRMVALVEESGVHHRKMIETLAEAKKIQATADEAHGEFLRVKAEADVVHGEYVQMRSELEALSEEMARLEMESREDAERLAKQRLEEVAVEKLHKGEKLTLDDLRVLVRKKLI
jgi:uncharacterized coiled-coil DUF342 family protein